jgi:hypothetical protein
MYHARRNLTGLIGRIAVAATMAFLIAVIPLGIAEGDPLVTDRPTFTASPLVVAPRLVLIEAGYTFTRQDEAEIHSIGEVLVRAGLIDRVEARIGINSYTKVSAGSEEVDGLQDSFLGMKVEVLEGSSESKFIPTTGLVVGSSLPTGDDAFTADELQPGANLCLAWNLTDIAGLTANLNATSVMFGEDRSTQFSGGLTLSAALSDVFGGFLEYYGYVQDSDYGPNTNFVNTGFTVLASDDLQFDGRVGFGLNTIDPDYFVGAGISQRFAIK